MNIVRNRSRLFLSTGTLFILAISVVAEDTTPAADQPAPTPADQTQAKAPSGEETQANGLQKAVQNPVASLISVPLQNNADFSYASFNRTQDVLNLEPVIPFKLGDKWNLIIRTIQPIVWQQTPEKK